MAANPVRLDIERVVATIASDFFHHLISLLRVLIARSAASESTHGTSPALGGNHCGSLIRSIDNHLRYSPCCLVFPIEQRELLFAPTNDIIGNVNCDDFFAARIIDYVCCALAVIATIILEL